MESAENQPALAAQRVKRLGREAGFDLVRITGADPLHVERCRYLEWIELGRQGEMRWITPEWAARSSDPTVALPDARSVVCVALSYWTGSRPAERPDWGRVARYAWGADYHAVIGDRLRGLAERLVHELGGAHRWYVDAGPLMDKALAARSGLGWYGKNTNILTERFGSFVLLGEVVTTLELRPDPPMLRDCGACRLCVAACPTGALGPDYTIDARTCISYLTIEHRGPIPRSLRPAVGSWVFGCDICQDVCPPSMLPHLASAEERRAWARDVRQYTGSRTGRPPSTTRPGAANPDPELLTPSGPLFTAGIRPDVDLVWLLGLTHEQYLAAFRGSAIRRAKVWMLRRNAAIALGNVGSPAAVEPLARALRADDHPLVRGHAAWALGRLAGRHRLPEIPAILRDALENEVEGAVREEVVAALADAVSEPRADVPD